MPSPHQRRSARARGARLLGLLGLAAGAWVATAAGATGAAATETLHAASRGAAAAATGEAIARPAAPGAARGVPSRLEPPPAGAILFVTQVPVPADFATIGSVFANHLAHPSRAARGGDLWIRYPDGALRNLTREAGLGSAGFQGAASIAVRDPAVHWNGRRALFSMVVGSPTRQYEVASYRWQIHEITGFGRAETPRIRRLDRQPSQFNNVSPVYASDGRVLFVSDRPRNGELHLYPQLDEYESTPTPTGLWSLDPVRGDLFLLQHSPSGSFEPLVDSFGRVVFTRWDHLQRDQQADADAGGASYGSFDHADETAEAARLPRAEELFPEPRGARDDLLAGTPWNGHRLNHFFPWEIRQDGTGEETLGHIGRHELHSYFDRSRHDDPNLREFIAAASGRPGVDAIENLLQIAEDPRRPGRYLGVDAPEFQTHASGRVVALELPPGSRPDLALVETLTHPLTATVAEGAAPPEHTGHYRDPLPLADGGLVAAHAAHRGAARNLGTRSRPEPAYRFRLRRLVRGDDGTFEPGPALTDGLEADVWWWDPDQRVEYRGELWELQPVEVRERPIPPAPADRLAAPERALFEELTLDEEAFRGWLRQRGLGVLVVRDVTSRDSADRQQPFNLQVPGGTATLDAADGATGTVYDVSELQLFQADQVRGYGGAVDPRPGRRVLPRPLHDAAAVAANAGPESDRVAVAADGSAAVFVPARRALAWQLLAPDGEPVVRERYWITVQPGEIRACDGCHGVNHENQADRPASSQPPDALRRLLLDWIERSP